MSNYCLKCGEHFSLVCACFIDKPSPPPAVAASDEECTPEQYALGRKIVVLDWLQYGTRWDEDKATLALQHMASLAKELSTARTENAALVLKCEALQGEVKRTKDVLQGMADTKRQDDHAYWNLEAENVALQSALAEEKETSLKFGRAMEQEGVLRTKYEKALEALREHVKFNGAACDLIGEALGAADGEPRTFPGK